jgi:hypothetical protein
MSRRRHSARPRSPGNYLSSPRGVTQPEALDLNVVIAETRDLLSTSAGAHVDLRVDPAADCLRASARADTWN